VAQVVNPSPTRDLPDLTLPVQAWSVGIRVAILSPQSRGLGM